LWHLEGQGSHRLPVHEGGSLVNRWLFTTTWGEQVLDGLLGPDPTNQIVQQKLGAEAATSSPEPTPSSPLTPTSIDLIATGKSRNRVSSKSGSPRRHAPANGVA
jgi:hypothetical protein